MVSNSSRLFFFHGSRSDFMVFKVPGWLLWFSWFQFGFSGFHVGFHWFWSKLSARGAKWGSENVAKGNRLTCIMAQRSCPLGHAGHRPALFQWWWWWYMYYDEACICFEKWSVPLVESRQCFGYVPRCFNFLQGRKVADVQRMKKLFSSNGNPKMSWKTMKKLTEIRKSLLVFIVFQKAIFIVTRDFWLGFTSFSLYFDGF